MEEEEHARRRPVKISVAGLPRRASLRMTGYFAGLDGSMRAPEGDTAAAAIGCAGSDSEQRVVDDDGWKEEK